MSKTNELTKFLDGFIDEHLHDAEEEDCIPDETYVAMLTEIKVIVEQHDSIVKEMLELREIVCMPEVAEALVKKEQQLKRT